MNVKRTAAAAAAATLAAGIALAAAWPVQAATTTPPLAVTASTTWTPTAVGPEVLWTSCPQGYTAVGAGHSATKIVFTGSRPYLGTNWEFTLQVPTAAVRKPVTLYVTCVQTSATAAAPALLKR